MTAKARAIQPKDPQRRQQTMEMVGNSMRRIHPLQPVSELPDDMQSLLDRLDEAYGRTPKQPA
jgi:hypothetical protein